MLFKDKVVIVTGASSGIGEGVVKHLLKEGAMVVGCGIEERMAIEDENAIYVQADLTCYEDAVKVVDSAKDAFKKVNSVINCAGICKIQSLETATTESFELEFKVNVTGIFNMCKAAIGELKSQADSTIVNVASDLGVRPIPERIGYCPSKAAVIMLTKCLAAEYAPYIRANCILPGLVETPMVKSRFSTEQELLDFRSTMSQIYPLKKLGSLEDMSNAILFLAGGNSGYITGEAIGVCGGSLI